MRRDLLIALAGRSRRTSSLGELGPGLPNPSLHQILHPRRFGFPFGVAVDNSAGASSGDVYLVMPPALRRR